VATPAERVRHRPEVCAGCGAALAEASVVSTEHRQVFDLPEIALRVVEHALEHRRCGCGRGSGVPQCMQFTVEAVISRCAAEA
jgi:hypothetical protein